MSPHINTYLLNYRTYWPDGVSRVSEGGREGVCCCSTTAPSYKIKPCQDTHEHDQGSLPDSVRPKQLQRVSIKRQIFYQSPAARPTSHS